MDVVAGAANVFWLRASPGDGKGMVLAAGCPPTWDDVTALCDTLMPESRNRVLGNGKTELVTRIRMPVTLEVYGSSLDAFAQESFDSSLPLVSGHALLWAWHYRMFLALRMRQGREIRLLWEAGLTMPLCANYFQYRAAPKVCLSIRFEAGMPSCSNLYNSLCLVRVPRMARRFRKSAACWPGAEGGGKGGPCFTKTWL